MRISDWSSDVCSSDLCCCAWNSFSAMEASESVEKSRRKSTLESPSATAIGSPSTSSRSTSTKSINGSMARLVPALHGIRFECGAGLGFRSEEHTSELQSLMRISYAVFCLKKKTQHNA